MAIDSVSLSMGYSVSQTTVSVKKESTVSQDKDSAAVSTVAKSDVFVKSESAETSVTYSKKLTAKQLEGIKNEQAESLKSLVQQMLGKQAANFTGGAFKIEGSFSISGMLGIDAAEETDATDFFNDPEWGVDAVATRLMDMAVSLSGGDTSKIALLRDAVERGFKAAGVEFGTDLPDVCQSTYTETMKRFDYWEENGTLEGYKMGAGE